MKNFILGLLVGIGTVAAMAQVPEFKDIDTPARSVKRWTDKQVLNEGDVLAIRVNGNLWKGFTVPAGKSYDTRVMVVAELQ